MSRGREVGVRHASSAPSGSMRASVGGFLVALVCVVLLAGAAAAGESASPPPTGLQIAGEFEGGKLYRAGKINVVVMKGNFYQMGRQYGAL